MDTVELRAAAGKLHVLHGRFAGYFGRRESREHSLQYLRGLLLADDRKSVEPMALVFGGPSEERANIDQRVVLSWQRFLTVSPWEARDVQQEIQVDRELRPAELNKFHLASPMLPKEPKLDLLSRQPVTFHYGGRTGMTTGEPLLKAAIVSLAEAWPGSIAFPDLLFTIRKRLNLDPLCSVETLEAHTRDLGRPFLEAYVSGLIELRCAPSRFTTVVGERPLASRLARVQAESLRGDMTNRRHETCRPGDLAMRILPLLDGTRDRAALLDRLAQLVEQGLMILPEPGEPAGAEQDLRRRLELHLDRAIQTLARSACLVE